METDNIVKQFEIQVQDSPDFLAVIDGDQKISYKALNEKSNQIAQYFKTEGVAPGDFVAILLEPSIDYIVFMLAIIKIGAAYLPLDCATPEVRLHSIIADADPKLIVTHQKQNYFTKDLDGIRDIKDIKIQCAHFSIENLSLDMIRPSSPIYMMYTSGSTGSPKGVVIAHQSVVNLCYKENYAKVKKM